MARTTYSQELRDELYRIAQYRGARYRAIGNLLYEETGIELHEDVVRRLVIQEREKRGDETPFESRYRDQQRQRLYRWENQFRTSRRMTPDEILAMVREAYSLYGVVWTGVIKYSGPSKKRATGNEFQIVLPDWAMEPMVVLHEAAHGLQRVLVPWKERQGGHSPVFARIMVELWDHFEVVDKAYAMAQTKRVKFAGDEWSIAARRVMQQAAKIMPLQA